jgi:hypothetical protein
MTRTTFTFQELAVLIQQALQSASTLSYVNDDNIVICLPKQKDLVPGFKDYLIRIFPADSGFLHRTPRIGAYFRNTYSVAIELWIKTPARLADKLGVGNIEVGKNPYDFLQNVIDVLEHNTFNDQLDSYAGSNISPSVMLDSSEEEMVGAAFVWTGDQDNIQ